MLTAASILRRRRRAKRFLVGVEECEASAGYPKWAAVIIVVCKRSSVALLLTTRDLGARGRHVFRV